MTVREAELAVCFVGGGLVCQQLMQVVRGHSVFAYMFGFALGMFALKYSSRKEK